MNQALRVTLLVVGWLLLAIAALGAIGYLNRPGNSAALAITALAPYLLFLGLPATVLLLVSRQWIGAGLACLAIVGFIVVQLPLWRSAPEVAGRQLIVMTFNMRLGQANATAVIHEVQRRDVAVLMVEELTPEAEHRLEQAGLSSHLPHKLSEPSGGAKGTGLWSRYPLAPVDWPPLTFNRIVARVAVPGMPVAPTVVALHVGGPVPSTTNWGRDLERLPAMLRGLPDDAPVVVGGDFNATYSVPQFRGLLTDGYADAAEQAGAGLTRTYRSDSWLPPVLGIDRVLVRDGVAREVDTVSVAGSDHRALVVRLTLADTR